MNNNSLMRLPELNGLSPTEETTFKKLVEEVCECNIAIIELGNYEKKDNPNWLLLSDRQVEEIRAEYKTKLNDVMGEIMDIAQVCVSQLFVFENSEINVQHLFQKFYGNMSCPNIFELRNNCRYIHFTPSNKNVTLETTMNKIFEYMGSIAQLSKFLGVNGEAYLKTISQTEAYDRYVYMLFEIIQKCFDLLYTMEDRYNIDTAKLFKEHVNKLIKKGYCKF